MTEEQRQALRELAGPPHIKSAQGWSQNGAGPFIADAEMLALVEAGYAEIDNDVARITKAGRSALT